MYQMKVLVKIEFIKIFLMNFGNKAVSGPTSLIEGFNLVNGDLTQRLYPSSHQIYWGHTKPVEASSICLGFPHKTANLCRLPE